MRNIIYVFCAFLLASLYACGGKDPGEVAAHAAKQYYDYLLQEKYDAFVDGQYRPDAIPSSYREQLIANAKMFMGQQSKEHRGIKEVRIVNAQADTARHAANVFLLFAYGDSTSEEVNVPMVEHEGIWYLR
ncbi:MAG: hypothetical protein IJK42_10590 [Prevotella sp.]|nr:hypothetical protein [Prevotella sp.]